MARPKTTDPKKWWHPQGYWRVRIGGRDYRLGRDEAQAESRRRALVGEWLLRGVAGPQPTAIPVDPARRTIDAVCAEYLERGVRPNIDHRHRALIEAAVDALGEWNGAKLAAWLGGPELKRWRQHLAITRKGRGGKPVSRTYVNHLVGAIKTCWRWALSERLVPADRAVEMLAVKSLREDEGGRETPAILPPPDGAVESILEYLPPIVRAMVRVQRLTGMRPGEVVRMRRCDLSVSPAEVLRPPNCPPVSAVVEAGVAVWVYAPPHHKTRKRGKVRLVALGPKAQAVLAPLLVGLAPTDHVFPPHAHRGGKVWGKMPGLRYSTESYGRAVTQVCVRHGLPRWTPGQLRHEVATDLFDDSPLDAAAVLGHARPEMSAHYAAATLKRAARVAAARG